MVTFIYPYRDRDTKRIKRSLDSLQNQDSRNFKVVFIDFGTELNLSKEVKKIVLEYDFVDYAYTYEIDRPWNKSKAINIALNRIKTDYVFISDVDVIYKPTFVSTLEKKFFDGEVHYFTVGLLSKEESSSDKKFEDYKIKFQTPSGATGLTLFPTKILKEIGGFDEYFHFWGAEDTEVHNRVKTRGYSVSFYDKERFILHQWHPIYRSYSDNELTKSLRCKYISKKNHMHLAYNLENLVSYKKSEAEIITKDLYNELKSIDRVYEFDSTKINLFHIKDILIHSEDTTLKINIKQKKLSLKELAINYIKGKNIEKLSLKSVNDELLEELILHYRNTLYTFKVLDKSLELIIKL